MSFLICTSAVERMQQVTYLAELRQHTGLFFHLLFGYLEYPKKLSIDMYNFFVCLFFTFLFI